MTVAPSIITPTVEQLDDRRRPDLDEIDSRIDQIRYRREIDLAREYMTHAQGLEIDATFRFRDVAEVSNAMRVEWLEKAATYARFASEALAEAANYLPFTVVKVGGSTPAA